MVSILNTSKLRIMLSKRVYKSFNMSTTCNDRENNTVSITGEHEILNFRFIHKNVFKLMDDIVIYHFILSMKQLN